MMRQAIVSLLWGAQREALLRFVRTQGPMTVFTLSSLIDADLERALAETGSAVVDLVGLLDVEQQRHVLQNAELDWSSLESGLTHEHLQQALGDLAHPGLTKIILETLQADLPTVLLLTAALNRAAEQHAIGLVVVNEDMQASAKTVVNWAVQKNIPSLHLAHALALSEPYTVHAHLKADVLAVYGERGCEGYLDIGIPPERIRVTGNPAWDGYLQWRGQRPQAREMLCQRYGYPVNRPIVVFGSTWAANLTALGDEHLYGNTLRVFIDACEQLRRAGWDFAAVIKDRPANAHFGTQRVEELLAESGANAAHYLHTSENGREWLLAADVLIAMDSNYSVEAMLAGTPAINLVNQPGVLLGPSFDAASGVLEVEPSELAAALASLLGDNERRRAMVAEMQARAGYYNLGVDGLATDRVAALMQEMMAGAAAVESYVWQTHLDVSVSDVEAAYHQAPREELIGAFATPPRFLLDVGCAAGATSGLFKQRHPHSRVWGIEVNESAAQIAGQRLDRVLVGKFEDFDLQAEGIEAGTLDGVILGDVLEHLYNPWAVMKALQPLLSPDAQLVISIPNVRNLWLMSELAQGYWKYEGAGLLDVTHIRFFTLAEFRRFLYETGYHTETLNYLLDGRVAQAYYENKDKHDVTLQVGNMTLQHLQPEDVGELCSLQFLIRARPGRDSGDLSRRYVKGTPVATDASSQVAPFVAQPFAAAVQEAPVIQYTDWLAARRSSPTRLDVYHQAIIQDAQLHFLVLIVGEAALAEVTLSSLTEQHYPSFTTVRLEQSVADLASWQAALANSEAAWSLKITAGDRLEPEALLRLAERILVSGNVHACYVDEDHLADNGPECPIFKAAFNLDLLRSYPYTGPLLAISREALLASTASVPAPGVALVQDLLLQVVERHGVTAIAHLPDVLHHSAQTFPDWLQQCEPAATHGIVRAHLARLGVPAEVGAGALPCVSRIQYLSDHQPLVSILIEAQGPLEELGRCLESILGGTAYPHYEILVGRPANVAADIGLWLDELVTLGLEQLRVIPADGPQSLAQAAKGEYLLWLSAGCLSIKASWLDELVNQARRPEVGVVGAKLLDREGKVAMAGLVLGLRGPASSLFQGEPDDRAGYLYRQQVVQNFSAVSGRCLLVRAEVFHAIPDCGSFATQPFADVEFCLRVGQAGYLVVWTPYARLGWESQQGFDDAELKSAETRLYQRWSPVLGSDPAYNSNLALDQADFTMELDADNLWRPLSWRPLPVIQVLPGDRWGCGHYRMIQPFQAMQSALLVDGIHQERYLEPVNQARIQADSIVVQRQITDSQLEALQSLKRNTSSFLVYDLDDLLGNLPLKSVHRESFQPPQVARAIRQALSIVDRLTVSTEPLAEEMRGLNPDIRVVPNRLPVQWWGDLQGGRREGRPRVGWAGGLSHAGDLGIVVDVMKELAGEVDWVFLGMSPPGAPPHEFHQGVEIEAFPAKLASLDLDLAIAPLEINSFNRCKSNLRLLELGACGFPIVATNIEPYRCGLPVTLVRNKYKDWLDAIREHLADREGARALGAELRAAIHRDWMLEGDNLLAWRAAWLPD